MDGRLISVSSNDQFIREWSPILHLVIRLQHVVIILTIDKFERSLALPILALIAARR